jgi:LmbE family N-acetylglucosaminyl deacetylase
VAQLFTKAPSTVLAVYAHPDDADVACGGSLARWARDGAAVHVILLADGGKGTIDPEADLGALVAERRREVATAAKALGVANVEHLDIPDGEVAEKRDLTELLVARIRGLQPDLVVGHDPTATYFGSVYVNHADHRAGGWALLDAVAPASAMPHYFPGAGPAHRVDDVLLSGTLEPDAYVDITETVDAKVEAVCAHRTQLSDELDLVAESIRVQGRADGQVAGVGFAEGFRSLHFGG